MKFYKDDIQNVSISRDCSPRLKKHCGCRDTGRVLCIFPSKRSKIHNKAAKPVFAFSRYLVARVKIPRLFFRSFVSSVSSPPLATLVFFIHTGTMQRWWHVCALSILYCVSRHTQLYVYWQFSALWLFYEVKYF